MKACALCVGGSNQQAGVWAGLDPFPPPCVLIVGLSSQIRQNIGTIHHVSLSTQIFCLIEVSMILRCSETDFLQETHSHHGHRSLSEPEVTLSGESTKAISKAKA